MCADWCDSALHGKVLTEATGKFVECIRQNVMDVMAHIAWMDRRTQTRRKIMRGRPADDRRTDETDTANVPEYDARRDAQGVVGLMRKSFPDVQWKLVDMVAGEKTVAVQWECSGTFNGSEPFAGLQPNGRRFTTMVMNFYSFDSDGRICKDVAATGIAGILQGIGAIP